MLKDLQRQLRGVEMTLRTLLNELPFSGTMKWNRQFLFPHIRELYKRLKLLLLIFKGEENNPREYN
jgi:hypothetical protein